MNVHGWSEFGQAKGTAECSGVDFGGKTGWHPDCSMKGGIRMPTFAATQRRSIRSCRSTSGERSQRESAAATSRVVKSVLVPRSHSFIRPFVYSLVHSCAG
jgi:hypothetical protein